MKKLLAIGLFTALAACAGLTPNKAIDSTSLVIEQIAIQVDQLQKTGKISNEREDAILIQLRGYNDDLRTAAALTGGAQTQTLQSINDELTALRAQLAKESK